MIFLIFFFLLVGCMDSFPGEKELNRVSTIADKRISQQCDLVCTGSGACWPQQCEAVVLHFDAHRSATIEEARHLIVKAVLIAVDSAQEVKDFQQYLRDPPFTADHIFMMIGFKKGALDMVSSTFGKVWYDVWNEKANRFDTVLKETFEEALSIVNAELAQKTHIE